MRAINLLGSKNAHGLKYPHPRYLKIVEPFAGGAGYSLNHLHHNVQLYDVRPSVVQVWQYLIKATPEEILALPLIEPDQDVRSLKCCEEGRLLISWCLQEAPHQTRTFSPWAKKHLETGSASYWSPKRRQRAAVLSSKIKHWQVRLTDWVHLLNHSEGPATYFIDPPYQRIPTAYGTPPLDYQRLADICRSLPGQVIVCEDQNADWLPFKPLYSLKTANIRHTTTEVYWTNLEE